MTLTFPRRLCAASLMVMLAAAPNAAAAASPAEQQLTDAAGKQQYAYVLFFRQDDAATKAMRQVVELHVAAHAGTAALVSVKVDDPAELPLVRRFDASRTPLPAVMGLAPNGAVTGMYPLKVESAQLERALLTPQYSAMVKALQEQKIAVLCLQPAGDGTVPKGIPEFEADPAFRGHTHRVVAQAGDAAEARFFERMKVSRDITAPVVLVFAPPGVYVGKFDGQVRGAEIARQVHASGRCNCEHCKQHAR